MTTKQEKEQHLYVLDMQLRLQQGLTMIPIEEWRESRPIDIGDEYESTDGLTMVDMEQFKDIFGEDK